MKIGLVDSRVAVVFEDHQDGGADPQAGGGECQAHLPV